MATLFILVKCMLFDSLKIYQALFVMWVSCDSRDVEWGSGANGASGILADLKGEPKR